MTRASAKRHFPSWVDAYVEATENRNSPRIFRKWAAITGIAAALERKVWVKSGGNITFPNLFTLLVGPPGVGKGQALSPLTQIFKELGSTHLAPVKVSGASLIDAINEAKKEVVLPALDPPVNFTYNSLFAISSELANLMPSYDNEFINALHTFYDNEDFSDKKRTGNINIKIPRAQLSLLGGTNPVFLGKFFAEGTWDQGFSARVILVFSADQAYKDPFPDEDDEEDDLNSGFSLSKELRPLLDDLKQISKPEIFFGRMKPVEEMKVAFREWLKAGMPPKPDHTKLLHYSTRRGLHLLKLCMVASASRGNDMIISLEDYQTAMGWLLEAEFTMSEIFHTMAMPNDSAVMEETFLFLFKEFQKGGGKPVAKHRIYNFIKEKAPSFRVQSIFDIMLRSNMMELTEDQHLGKLAALKPVAKQLHKTNV